MAFHFLVVFALLQVSHGGAVMPEEAYWKSLFPNNPMPKALKDILPKSFNAPTYLRGGYGSGYGHSSKEFHAPNYVWGSYGDGHDDPSKEFKRETISLEGNVALLNETTFFFQEDLRTGKLVNLPRLATTSDKTPFFPNQIAETMPFSSDKLPEIVNNLSLKPQTREAGVVNETIRGCERAAIDGEQKFCATSFESFIDSSVSKLGKQIQLLSSVLSKETKNPLFTIVKGMENMGENELICHKMEYPGAVFMCHSINKTVVYKVPLVSGDGTQANALVVCHKDTWNWNPKHLAFRVLKVKPGTGPICHFLGRDTLVWVSSSTTK
ncbi:putative BURP domain-containing protein [Hibiscus syriacus]|uniref:BURP domain-containing protein n=1 Tax=Hibiscus syriacus TaxID=106335 RepID=A0A6A2YR87_HIBSY|nr:BURP domain protein RD22-like [Hibiscus syriacus]KAE8681951.1 putative BURP domain-containing protein [Hibiscus syriacus]